MKCNNCGKEFGNNLTCQYCGLDRVAGLAGYPGRSSISPTPSMGQSTPNENQSALCWKCEEIIPASANFCPFCGAEMKHTCPKCGNTFSAQYPICPECGTNYEEGLSLQEQKEKEQQEQEKQMINKFQEFLDTFQLVFVEGGTFNMGATTEQGAGSFLCDRKPVHAVTLDHFLISKYPVTQKLWKDVMGYNNSVFVGDDNPVENISLIEVYDFLNAARERFGVPFRLPTEAEWEYAARGGRYSKGFTYPGGNNLGELGWVKFNSSKKTHPVGQKEPNELGLYDMVGNVFEFVQDTYDAKYYSKSPSHNPCNNKVKNMALSLISGASSFVVRGCSYYFDGKYATSSYRYYVDAGGKDDNLGFRIAVDCPSLNEITNW